jgi:hypothetical protein
MERRSKAFNNFNLFYSSRSGVVVMFLETPTSRAEQLASATIMATALFSAAKVWHYYRKHSKEREYHLLLDRIPPKSISDFEEAAMIHLSPLARVYFQFFAEKNSSTYQGHRQFVDSIRLSPTILTGDVRNIDTTLRYLASDWKCRYGLLPPHSMYLRARMERLPRPKGLKPRG